MKVPSQICIVSVLNAALPSLAFNAIRNNKIRFFGNTKIINFTRKKIPREPLYQSTTDDEAAEIREALKGIEFSQMERKYSKAEPESIIEAAILELDALPDIQELKNSGLVNKDILRKALDEEFEKAVIKIKETADEIRNDEKKYIEKKGEKVLADFLSKTSEDDEKRLAEAEGRVQKMVSKVNKEAEQMEAAMEELTNAKEKMNADPFFRVSNFRNVGLPKQAAFVMSLLMLSRSLTDLIQITGYDGDSHLQLGLIQGIISFFCGAYFFLM
mmetsp:Transcript_47432/g.92564  ORF Transcript_47432/g.92564 Transcript_47432/m.92564 type:complete len:272 (+) Transcript_47432:415-1230(+)